MNVKNKPSSVLPLEEESEDLNDKLMMIGSSAFPFSDRTKQVMGQADYVIEPQSEEIATTNRKKSKVSSTYHNNAVANKPLAKFVLYNPGEESPPLPPVVYTEVNSPVYEIIKNLTPQGYKPKRVKSYRYVGDVNRETIPRWVRKDAICPDGRLGSLPDVLYGPEKTVLSLVKRLLRDVLRDQFIFNLKHFYDLSIGSTRRNSAAIKYPRSYQHQKEAVSARAARAMKTFIRKEKPASKRLLISAGAYEGPSHFRWRWSNHAVDLGAGSAVYLMSRHEFCNLPGEAKAESWWHLCSITGLTEVVARVCYDCSFDEGTQTISDISETQPAGISKGHLVEIGQPSAVEKAKPAKRGVEIFCQGDYLDD